MPVTNYHTVNGRLIGETTSGVRTDYLTDALGSITATVNQSAQIVNTYRYKPFGERLAKTGSGADPRFQFTGDTGSVTTSRRYAENYNRRRSLDVKNGRWGSVDPIWPVELAFAYVRSNPTTLIDPMGLAAIGPCGNRETFIKNLSAINAGLPPHQQLSTQNIIAQALKNPCCKALVNVGLWPPKDFQAFVNEIEDRLQFLAAVIKCMGCQETTTFYKPDCHGPHHDVNDGTPAGLFGFTEPTRNEVGLTLGEISGPGFLPQIQAALSKFCKEACAHTPGCGAKDCASGTVPDEPPHLIVNPGWPRPRSWPYLPGPSSEQNPAWFRECMNNIFGYSNHALDPPPWIPRPVPRPRPSPLGIK